MLRAVVQPGGKQRVLEQVPPYEIAAEDLRGRSDGEQAEALDRVRGELADQVLPTEEWPPFDIRASLLDEDRVRLHLSMDLLFVDVRSLFVVLDEWRRFYDDPSWTPEPLELTFRDYVLAEQALESEALGKRSADYWLSRVDELSPGPDLPIGTAPERLGRPTFTRRRAALAPERWAALSDAAHRHGLTPNNLLLAAYAEVLRTWSRRQEFTLTLTQLHRLPLHPQAQRIVGDFLSPGLLTVGGTAEESFAERAAGVQRQLLADLAHSAFGGIRVLRELTRRQGDGRNVSMPVVFSSMLGADGDAATADAPAALRRRGVRHQPDPPGLAGETRSRRRTASSSSTGTPWTACSPRARWTPCSTPTPRSSTGSSRTGRCGRPPAESFRCRPRRPPSASSPTPRPRTSRRPCCTSSSARPPVAPPTRWP
ncbi:hypothetical protein GCM10020221_05540 [Streptomyces thioluteus]|uniref:Condensation domain-containing protein n=1 Tax=Streptomyces thioluteus TaxID=66431 RepID=A0ABN3WEP8_STRTU